MSVTLIQSPPHIAYSRRKIAVVVETDRVDPSHQATVLFAFSGNGATDGEAFTLRWAGNTVVFTFKTTPDASGLQLPIWDGAGRLLDYIGNLATALRQHYLILEAWTVTIGVDTLLLTAKSNDAVSPTIIGNLTNVTITPTAAPSPYLDVNLSAYVRAIDYTGTPMGAPFNVPYNAETRRAEFDLQSAFSHLKPHVPLARTLNPAQPFRSETASDAFNWYSFRYADKSGFPPTPQKMAASDDMIAVYGTAKDFPTDPKNRAVALHPTPTIRKQVGLKQPDYAYILPLQTWFKAFIEVTLYLDNGQTLLYFPENGARFQIGQDILLLFRTGFHQLKLDNLTTPPKTRIAAYDWRLMHDNTANPSATEPLTEIVAMRYDVDYQTAERDMYLLLDNGLGGMETLRLRGAIREKYTVEMTEIENYDGSRDTFAEEVTQTSEVTTAVMPTTMARYYRQLLRGQLWLCDVKKYRFIKVVRVTKEVEINPNVPFNALKFAFSVSEKEL